MFNPTQLNQLLSSSNLYQHVQDYDDWPNCSWDIAHLRILQSIWLRSYLLITQEPEFSQIHNLCRQKANNMKFHLKQSPDETNAKFLEKL